MANARTNLQNTDNAKVVADKVTFDSDGTKLVGTLYTPKDQAGPFPGVVVTGAWTTVKEQMAGTYARELAARGFAALAFDFNGWGESGGTPRYVEDPATKTRDIEAAIGFLASHPSVQEGMLGGLGVCASSGYMADAAASRSEIVRVALVAPWLHDPALAETIYGGPDAAAALIAASETQDAADVALLAASATDESAVMYQAPYYTEPDRGLIDAFDNKFSPLSWKPWLTYDAMKSADRLDKPMLMVGSPSIALPAGAEAYAAKTRAPLEKLWLGEDVTQFDFYDRADVVEAAADAVADFLAQ